MPAPAPPPPRITRPAALTTLAVLVAVAGGCAGAAGSANRAAFGHAMAPLPPDLADYRRDAASGGQKRELAWRGSPGAAWYEVLVRRRRRPAHERVAAVGWATTYPLDERLDDAWASVRAAGANGHRSLATPISAFAPARR